MYLVELLIRRSGYRLTASDRELVDIVIGLASGIVDKDDLIELQQGEHRQWCNAKSPGMALVPHE